MSAGPAVVVDTGIAAQIDFVSRLVPVWQRIADEAVTDEARDLAHRGALVLDAACDTLRRVQRAADDGK